MYHLFYCDLKLSNIKNKSKKMSDSILPMCEYTLCKSTCDSIVCSSVVWFTLPKSTNDSKLVDNMSCSQLTLCRMSAIYLFKTFIQLYPILVTSCSHFNMVISWCYGGLNNILNQYFYRMFVLFAASRESHPLSYEL